MHVGYKCMEFVAEGWCIQSNYKRSYLWLFKNPACGDLTESNRIEKDWICVTPGFVSGKREKGWCNLVHVERL